MTSERLAEILVDDIIQNVYDHTGYNMPDKYKLIWTSNIATMLKSKFDEGIHVGRDHYEKK
jgi:hypothetical protein